jgi:hypothetical protein
LAEAILCAVPFHVPVRLGTTSAAKEHPAHEISTVMTNQAIRGFPPKISLPAILCADIYTSFMVIVAWLLTCSPGLIP